MIAVSYTHLDVYKRQVFDECSFFEGEKVLEVGCGDASLWTQNIDRIPADMQITLTDISYGMVRDATRNVGADDKRFTYEVMDAHRLYKPDASYDCVIADHVLFYCDNLDAVCSEILRVLKPGGVFVCSTYSSRPVSYTHLHILLKVYMLNGIE